MKKFAKMSLAAAVAVSGLSTAAVAGSLEEAVKNTDISGKVYTEFITSTDKDSTAEAGETSSRTDIDFDITFKTKVNDNVTAVTELEADSTSTDGAKGNGNQSVVLKKVYFAYTNNNITANFGRMGAKSPVADGDRYEGASVSYDAGMVRVYADHGVTNDDTKGDVTNLALMGSAGPVNGEVWYTNYSYDATAGDDFGKTLTVVGDVTVEGVKLFGRYASTNFNNDATADGATLKLGAEATFEGVKLSGQYIQTDEDNASAVTDREAKNGFEMSDETLNFDSLSTRKDITGFVVGASMPVGDTTYAVDYASLDADTANDEGTELRLKATHKMSSNFKVTAAYSLYEVDFGDSATTDVDANVLKVDMKYSF